MADTLRASQKGLKIVDQVRKRRGWTKYDTAWWQLALTTKATLKRFWQPTRIQRETFIRICDTVGVRWQEICQKPCVGSIVDWESLVDVSIFYGRDQELSTLKTWIVNSHCRVVALLGMGGVGKTALSVKLVEQIHDKFEYVVQRSLAAAPPLTKIVADVIGVLSDGAQADLSDNIHERVSLLIRYLRSHRCLLVFDDVEMILNRGELAGNYCQGYEGYGELIRRLAEERHQSCLLLISREKPKEIASLEGDILPIHSLKLRGLHLEAKELLAAKGLSEPEQWRQLIEIYQGNPLALKIVSTTIIHLFNGKVSQFFKQSLLVWDLIPFLDDHFTRCSVREQEILYWLAIERKPVPLSKLQQNLRLSPISSREILYSMESLERRMLIENGFEAEEICFTLEPMLMKYVKQRFLQEIYQELLGLIKSKKIDSIQRLKSHYIGQNCETGVPNNQGWMIIKTLKYSLGLEIENVEDTLHEILAILQREFGIGYAADNISKLLAN